MKKLRKFLIGFLFFCILLMAPLTWLAREFFVPLGEPGTQEVVIHEGSRAADIAESLQSAGLIRSTWSFNLLVYLTKTGETIHAGDYQFSTPTSAYQILKKLVRGDSVKVQLTVPEGFTNRQIADLLASHRILGKKEFLKAASNAELRISSIVFSSAGLEGFLFPDTYEIFPHSWPQEVYRPMLARFQELVLPLFQTPGKKKDLRNVIILASLVQAEGKLPREFPLIAAVYCNRLKKKIPLQCDATIQYLLPKPKTILTGNELKIDSPYNTYLHPGLPPGPIGNPGIEAIKAALHPAKVPYLYYVAKGDGSHLFSVTYQEHLRAAEHYWNQLRIPHE